MSQDEPMVAISAQTLPNVDLVPFEGEVIEVTFDEGRGVVLAGVSAFDSKAKAEGTDIFFMVCGEECADELTASYTGEIANT